MARANGEKRIRRMEMVQALESRYLLSTSTLPVVTQLVIQKNLHLTPEMFAAGRLATMAKPVVLPTETTAKATANSSSTGSSSSNNTTSSGSKNVTPAATANATPNSSAGSLSTASLAGRVVYTSGGHGFVWRDSSSSWGYMRPYLNNMIEDLGNQDQVQYFADYLLHAGATVVSARPLGHQTNEVIVDNATTYSASTGGFQIESGTWTSMTDGPYWSNSPTGSDLVHYVTASTSLTETAAVRFTPNIPQAGFYPVYAWYNPGANSSSNNRVSDQTFRINYSGGSYEVKVAVNKTGKGWVYLGDYYFAAGVNPASGSVEISNKSATTGKKVVADAIRFGNGMGDVNYSYSYPNGTSKAPVMKTFAVSGVAREDEAALYWCYAERGWESPNNRTAPSVVYGGTSTDDETKNFSACDAYATYMNQQNVGSTTDRLWISFHSNATDGTGTRGTLGLINTLPTAHQAQLALIAGRTIQNDMQGLDSTHQYDWAMNPTPTYSGGYSEISTSVIGSEFDATIIEVAYHDNAIDAALLKDPTVRDDVGEAAYHAAVQYFKVYGGLSASMVYLPEPPTDLRATTDDSGNVTVSWSAGPSSPYLSGYNPLGTDDVNSTGDNPGPYGQPATSYKVYTSTNGYGFDGGVPVSAGTSLTFTSLSTTSPTYFKVTAINAAGESLGSYVVVAKPQSNNKKSSVLIVNDFTRLDYYGDQTQSTILGTVFRARAMYNNSFNYVVQAASSILDYNPQLGVDSTSVSSISSGGVNLSDYQAVIWMSGEQATSRFTTFDAATQALVSSYLSGGGKMFISGSNVAFNLSASGDNKGATFLSSTLHTSYVRDDANTYSFGAGISGSAFASVPAGSFDNGTHGTYDVDAPDGISPVSGALAALLYSGGTGGTAAIQYSSGNTRLILLAFPLESVYTTATRDALVAGAMNYFGFSATGLPDATPAPGAPDLQDGSDTGPINSDNITKLNNSAGHTLQFVVPNTIAGATVQLFSDGTLIGQAVASGTSTVITTNGSATLTDGNHTITALQTSPGMDASLPSSALTLTIDTVAPTANIAAASSPRSTPLPSATVTFSETIAGFDPGDFALSRDGAAIAYGSGQTFSIVGNAYTLNNLSNLTTNAGAYILGISAGASAITDLAGNPLATDQATSWNLNTIAGTTASDSVVIARNATNPSALDVRVNGNAVYTVSLTNLGTLTVATDAGDDTLTLDFSAGQPVFDSGSSLVYLSGTATNTDSLLIIGTAGDDTLNLDSSTATLNGGATISYNTGGLTPIDVQFKGSTGNDTWNVTHKAINFATDAADDTANLTLNLGIGGVANLLASQHLAGLHLSGIASVFLTAGGDKVLATNSLSISGPSKLDLADNDMIVNDPSMSLSTIQSYLANNSIRSSSAANNPDDNTTLGYGLASDLGVNTFSNEPVVPSALLIKYTYHGDTDLDGRVTADDLIRADRGRAKNLSTWLWGDSNYDGVVDATDISLATSAFATQGPIL